MNITEHLLTCLAEEAAEVAQDCGKALRFGLDDINVNNPGGPNNCQRLIVELNQLIAVANMLADRGCIPQNWIDPRTQLEKKDKVRKFMIYAHGVGALIPDPPKKNRSSRSYRSKSEIRNPQSAIK